MSKSEQFNILKVRLNIYISDAGEITIMPFVFDNSLMQLSGKPVFVSSPNTPSPAYVS